MEQEHIKQNEAEHGLTDNQRVLEIIDLHQSDHAENEIGERQEAPIIYETIDSISYSKEAVDNFIKAIEKGYVQANLMEDDRIEIKFLPIQNLPKELGHLTEENIFRGNINADTWGDTNGKTYLQTIDFGVEAYMDNDHMIALGGRPKRIVRLYVDTERLLKERKVYLDPESINVTENEFEKSFMVLGGIPRSVIVRGEIVEILPRNPKEFVGEMEEKNMLTKEEIEVEMAAQKERFTGFFKNREN